MHLRNEASELMSGAEFLCECGKQAACFACNKKVSNFRAISVATLLSSFRTFEAPLQFHLYYYFRLMFGKLVMYRQQHV